MIKPNIPEQDLARARDIVLNALTKRFSPEDFAFDPIVVEPDYDQDGDEILWIQIVFDGDQEKLDPDLTSDIYEDIGPEMKAYGIAAYPIASFIEKSEWEDPAYLVPDWAQ